MTRDGTRLRLACSLAAIVAAIGSVSAGCGRQPAQTRDPPPASAGIGAEARPRVEVASLLTRGRSITGAEWERWQRERRNAAAIVDELVEDRFLSERVAPSLLFKHHLQRGATQLFAPAKLREASRRGTPFLYLKRPCELSATVQVRPWWDPSTPVRVCRDAILPAVWETAGPHGGRFACDSQWGSPQYHPATECGCGPALVRCYPATGINAMRERFEAAAREEVRATAARLVAADAPLAQLFLTNATVRNRDTDTLYRLSEVESLRLADPLSLFDATARPWPNPAELAPRQELETGAHAGVLTAWQFLYHVFDPRQRQRIFFSLLWCTAESAPGAAPEDVLSLHTPDLSAVNAGWKELAARPFCTQCHARLDHGLQFFRAYPASTTARHYVVGTDRSEIGELYGASIDDPRGKAALQPHSFAVMATAQPEFARCMARNVAEYVFGPASNEAIVDALAGSAKPAELRFRGLMKRALTIYLDCTSCGAAPLAGAGVGRPIALAKLVEQHCTACHHDGADVPSFERPLDRAQSARILDHVVSGRMPPGGGADLGVKAQFIDAALGQANASAKQSAAARFVLESAAAPPAALPYLTSLEQLRASAGQGELATFNTIENAVDGQNNVFTPNFAAITAISAFRACTGAAARDECIDRALGEMWKVDRPLRSPR